MPEEVSTLYRPVGQAEFELIRASGFCRFPPRLPQQPFFYAVLNEQTQRGLLATGIQRTRVQASWVCAALHAANGVFEPVRDSHLRQRGTSGILDTCGRSAQIERKHCWSYRSYFAVSARGMSTLALAPTRQKDCLRNIAFILIDRC
jgi:hypothetical protein